jgi:hypothetical protein
MQYFGAYRFIFEHPKWPMLLLIGAVCQFVPIAGPLVIMGYLYSVIEAKHRNGPDQFPAFDFDRLGDYLLRGVWPFLASLAVALPVVLVVLLTMFSVIAFVFSSQQLEGSPPPALIILVPLLILGIGFVIFVAHILMLPLTLRAGLSQDLRTAFSMAFVQDFLGRVWPEMLLSMLFLVVTAPFLMIAGFLMLIIGIYVATVVMTFAQFHFHYQLYELYLQRGGTPIPLKESPLPAV